MIFHKAYDAYQLYLRTQLPYAPHKPPLAGFKKSHPCNKLCAVGCIDNVRQNW